MIKACVPWSDGVTKLVQDAMTAYPKYVQLKRHTLLYFIIFFNLQLYRYSSGLLSVITITNYRSSSWHHQQHNKPFHQHYLHYDHAHYHYQHQGYHHHHQHWQQNTLQYHHHHPHNHNHNYNNIIIITMIIIIIYYSLVALHVVMTCISSLMDWSIFSNLELKEQYRLVELKEVLRRYGVKSTQAPVAAKAKVGYLSN